MCQDYFVRPGSWFLKVRLRTLKRASGTWHQSRRSYISLAASLVEDMTNPSTQYVNVNVNVNVKHASCGCLFVPNDQAWLRCGTEFYIVL